jgi:hypothetical protein
MGEVRASSLMTFLLSLMCEDPKRHTRPYLQRPAPIEDKKKKKKHCITRERDAADHVKTGVSSFLLPVSSNMGHLSAMSAGFAARNAATSCENLHLLVGLGWFGGDTTAWWLRVV